MPLDFGCEIINLQVLMYGVSCLGLISSLGEIKELFFFSFLSCYLLTIIQQPIEQ